MSILTKIFRRNKEKQSYRIGGMGDFMTLISVYYQSAMAVQLGISNLSLLPDLRTFKQTLKVATVNNRLGIGERAKCRKMLIDIYGMSESFFKEIDQSVKRGCKTVNDAQSFQLMFRNFSQDLLMVMADQLKLKLRLPGFMHKMLRTAVRQKVHDVMTRPDWKDESTRRTCAGIRLYAQRLGYSEDWVFEYVNTLLSLAKKEPAQQNNEG